MFALKFAYLNKWAAFRSIMIGFFMQRCITVDSADPFLA